MSELSTDAGSPGGEDIAVIEAPASAPESLSIRGAMRALQQARRPKETTETTAITEPAAPVEAAADPTKSPAQAEDGSPQEPAVTAETTESQAEAAQEPPIEPPRSWKADEKERFKSLPRETQAYLAERETERDRALNRSQNEAAEKLKGLTAKEQAVEQARAQYEAAL